MSLELDTFLTVMGLPSSNIAELVDTIGCAAQLSTPLRKSPKDKILVACTMMSHANAMLEQCGCTITTHINNPDWKGPSIYKTEMEKV